MINQLILDNFKCFEHLELGLNNVNVLTGLNGMGKSSVIQSILLLRQSYLDNRLCKGLFLNGKYVQLGNGQDILFENAQTEEVRIRVKESNVNDYVFAYSALSQLLPRINVKETNTGDSIIFNDGFSYLSAYRIEPREFYGVEDEVELSKKELGNAGEYAVQYLYHYGAECVVNEHVLKGQSINVTLQEQVRQWLAYIAPGIVPRVSVDYVKRVAELQYEFVEGRNRTNSYKNVNVGFGITYVLPIIVALLSAKEGELVILENPEAHIHPGGQRKLGELIALAGAGGVQVIVETHSDHILNGIRIAAKNHLIHSGQVGIFFFYKDSEDGYRHKVLKPALDDKGRISQWPEGFFDEWDNALLELL